MAGALTGFAPDQAVFRDHQGHSAVGQKFTGNTLAQIPDLRHSHFKAQANGLQFQFRSGIHRPGVIDVQAKIAPNTHAALPCRNDMADIAHQHLADTKGFHSAKISLETVHLTVVENPGCNGTNPETLGQHLTKLRIFYQEV